MHWAVSKAEHADAGVRARIDGLCREHKPKRELIRVVRSPEGAISLDFRGKSPGRGAYLCPSADCLARARKSRALERAFDCAIPDEIYDALTKQMEEHTL